ncbi:hypothetical protein NP493_267g00008 [Ridgeia piscesae]|uniref:Uncharacterized protein n=1 Tax=Ridgeia piscesae TaxID=27915 RepID=A0AAD9UCM2_RIDPI|nr:hypothetical protein NP493_267g00008 [Ridgeia piscesae]
MHRDDDDAYFRQIDADRLRHQLQRSRHQIEEAERRQKVLLDIMKKELAHNQRMRELKARQAEQQAVKARIRDKRQQSTRIRRYYNDYQVQMRSKMLKKRTKEEQVFKKLFRDGLDIQKERIRELRRYAREQREHRAERHHADLVSLENYYKDQFSMLSESLAKEKADTEVRDKAQARILEQMKKELRKKMEKEVKDFQEQLCRDDDDAYFRQIDADRLRHQLQMSRYQVQI